MAWMQLAERRNRFISRKVLRAELVHSAFLLLERYQKISFSQLIFKFFELIAHWLGDFKSTRGSEPSAFVTHSMRITKVAQIYKTTGNLRAVKLLLGNRKMDNTVRYLGVDLEDALAISESVEIYEYGSPTLAAQSRPRRAIFASHCVFLEPDIHERAALSAP